MKNLLSIVNYMKNLLPIVKLYEEPFFYTVKLYEEPSFYSELNEEPSFYSKII